VVDKVKGHILADNLKVLLDHYTESSDVHKTLFVFDKALKKWQEQELFTFPPSMLALITHKSRVAACWSALRSKVVG
jgi:hypothetical protein